MMSALVRLVSLGGRDYGVLTFFFLAVLYYLQFTKYVPLTLTQNIIVRLSTHLIGLERSHTTTFSYHLQTVILHTVNILLSITGN